MNVCVFCSSNDLEDKYLKPAKELIGMLAEAKCNMVFGGSDYGLMKEAADVVKSNGGKLIGITIPVYQEYLRHDLDEAIVVKDLGERKKMILDRSDVVLVLIGGIGTIDELFDVMELKRQGYHNKPIVVLNTDNFYGGLISQLKRIEDEKLFKAGDNSNLNITNLDNFMQFVDEPKDVMDLILENN